jgi:hypothetical protein
MPPELQTQLGRICEEIAHAALKETIATIERHSQLLLEKLAAPLRDLRQP